MWARVLPVIDSGLLRVYGHPAGPGSVTVLALSAGTLSSLRLAVGETVILMTPTFYPY